MDLISREQALSFLNDLFGEMQTVTFNDVLQSFEKLPSAFEGMTTAQILSQFLPEGAYLSTDIHGRIHIRGMKKEQLDAFYEKGD